MMDLTFERGRMGNHAVTAHTAKGIEWLRAHKGIPGLELEYKYDGHPDAIAEVVSAAIGKGLAITDSRRA